MDSYSNKILELLSIENNEEDFHLLVKLTYQTEWFLKLKVDCLTAEQLNTILSEDQEKFKYRLTFNHYHQLQDNLYSCYVTRTYREYSERVTFQCSEVYIDYINKIKSMINIDEINHLLSDKSFTKDQVNHPNEQEQTRKLQSISPKNKILVLCFFFVCTSILFGYIKNGYPGNHVFAENPMNHSKKITSMEVMKSISNKSEWSPTLVNHSKEFLVTEAITHKLPEGYVALTFDDGPSKYTKEIVNILLKFNVGATFFLVGKNVKNDPESVEYIYNKGLSIANHSMSHSDFSRLDYKNQELELLETKTLIEEITHQPISLFRPPYGSSNFETNELMARNQNKMILWNKDTEDWKNKSSEDLIQFFEKSNPSGSIFLLHESQDVIEALPESITYLQKENLQIVGLK